MNKKKLKNTLIGVGKDILIASAMVCIVMLGLYAYCGVWPPMVVVESGSMQHSDSTSHLGVIDTGDMVFVKKVGGTDELVTYVDGEATDYSRYGAYGDVIIFRPDGNLTRTPIIHRAVVWIDVNETAIDPFSGGTDYANITFDVPSMSMYGTLEPIEFFDYGHQKLGITIDLESLLEYYERSGKEPHGGYITMGDNNVPYYDQHLIGSGETKEPVLPEWIVGKAVGEIPWFGLIKLKVTGTPLHGVPQNSWTNLYITVFLLLFVPFMVDLLSPGFIRWMRKRKGPAAGEPGADECMEKDGEALPAPDGGAAEDPAAGLKKDIGAVPEPDDPAKPEELREGGETPPE